MAGRAARVLAHLRRVWAADTADLFVDPDDSSEEANNKRTAGLVRLPIAVVFRHGSADNDEDVATCDFLGKRLADVAGVTVEPVKRDAEKGGEEEAEEGALQRASTVSRLATGVRRRISHETRDGVLARRSDDDDDLGDDGDENDSGEKLNLSQSMKVKAKAAARKGRDRAKAAAKKGKDKAQEAVATALLEAASASTRIALHVFAPATTLLLWAEENGVECAVAPAVAEKAHEAIGGTSVSWGDLPIFLPFSVARARDGVFIPHAFATGSVGESPDFGAMSDEELLTTIIPPSAFVRLVLAKILDVSARDESDLTTSANTRMVDSSAEIVLSGVPVRPGLGFLTQLKVKKLNGTYRIALF
jgi:hypothetical protein